MKKINSVLFILGILIAPLLPASAIEGLKIAVQSANVVLSWPSVSNETYVVQYEPTLNLPSSWMTLTDNFPAALNTNMTFFVISNSVNYPDVLLGNGGSGSGAATASATTMAKPINGSGDAVPLALYPVGFDLSTLLIFNPATGTWTRGSGYVQGSSSETGAGVNGLQPDDNSNGTNNNAGFYRVVRDGAHPWGITNGIVLHDEVITPIEYAVTSTDIIAGVSFYDSNGNPLSGASAYGSGNNWALVWNTLAYENGNYNIYAQLDFASDNSVVGVPVAVTVNNVISFPNYFTEVFGDQMWIYAETVPNAPYQIDIYDEYTNHLGAFVGTTDSSGVISFTWNLTDGSGNTYDSTNFTGVFTVQVSSPSGQSSVQTQHSVPVFQKSASQALQIGGGAQPQGTQNVTATQLWVKEPTWTPNNNWVVAYGLFNGQSGESSQNDVYMITGGPSGEYGGVLGTLDQYGLNGNLSPGNSAQNGTVFTVQDQASRTNLLSYLAYPSPTYENFYFFGHGNGNAIGSYNGYILTSAQIAFALGNVPFSLNGPNELTHILPPMMGITYPVMMPRTFDTQVVHAALHPYRFVFIDACDTGVGNFCEAFGIPALTANTNYFATAGVESRAFVGMQSWKLNLNIIGWQGYSEMTGQFLGNWLTGHQVQDCVNTAQSPFNGTGAQMSSSAVIYGAADLTITTRTRP